MGHTENDLNIELFLINIEYKWSTISNLRHIISLTTTGSGNHKVTNNLYEQKSGRQG